MLELFLYFSFAFLLSTLTNLFTRRALESETAAKKHLLSESYSLIDYLKAQLSNTEEGRKLLELEKERTKAELDTRTKIVGQKDTIVAELSRQIEFDKTEKEVLKLQKEKVLTTLELQHKKHQEIVTSILNSTKELQLQAAEKMYECITKKSRSNYFYWPSKARALRLFEDVLEKHHVIKSK